MSPERVVIVGGGLSGLRVAEKLRRQGHAGPVTLVGAEAIVGYDRPPLSKSLLTQPDDPATPALLRTADTYAELRLDLRAGVRATALDLAAGLVTLDDGDTVPFDRLVVATGVRARTIPALTGPSGVHTLRTWEDCLQLRAALRRSQHLTVIGGGVLGCEIAASARTLGLEVALVEYLDQPLARVLGSTVGGVVAGMHREHGVKLHCGAQVQHLAVQGDRVSAVVLADGSSITTDLVVAAVGSAPNTEWLEGSGIELRDGVMCDRTGTSSAEDVLAVGDVARMPHPYADGTVRLEHWTSAGDTATLVAENVLRERADRRDLSEVPYFWSDQYGSKLQCLGLAVPDDELTVADGSLESGKFLALYARDGLVTGAVAIGKPAALARCRTAIAARIPLDDLLVAAPWDRTKAPSA